MNYRKLQNECTRAVMATSSEYYSGTGLTCEKRFDPDEVTRSGALCVIFCILSVALSLIYALETMIKQNNIANFIYETKPNDESRAHTRERERE